MSPEKQKEYANAWVPRTDGETLTGELVEITRAWSDWRAKSGSEGDGWYPLLYIKLESGQVTMFHAFQTVAYNQVRTKQPLPGETVIVTYQGEGEGKNGNNPPKLFRIDIEGRNPQTAARNTYAQLFGRDEVNEPDPPTEAERAAGASVDFDTIPFT